MKLTRERPWHPVLKHEPDLVLAERTWAESRGSAQAPCWHCSDLHYRRRGRLRKLALVSLLLTASLTFGTAGHLGATTSPPRDNCPPGPALLSLSIDYPPDLCLHPGDLLHVTLAVSCIDIPLTGYQAFLEFDPNALAFVEGNYVLPEPFGLPLIYPIIAADGAIDLAAGINPFAGQQTLSADADLAHLVFQANSTIDVARIRFRVSEPSTRVSTPDGPLAPALQNSPAFLLRSCASCLWSDLNCDDVGDLADFHVFGNCMHGPNVPVSDACVPADLNDDMDVDLHDFAEFQRLFAGGQP